MVRYHALLHARYTTRAPPPESGVLHGLAAPPDWRGELRVVSYLILSYLIVYDKIR